ncbi:hypothetical protein EVAR_18321_1 [Eumeta japonica]|uniref:Uncharacterized protein n=1 Tax=Eumeta variegata TaxID=151549 RepID=A0A4C1V968_EUMVA|nr:hypothetical protein EVAR_18321_1 [Eumeta japonica]
MSSVKWKDSGGWGVSEGGREEKDSRNVGRGRRGGDKKYGKKRPEQKSSNALSVQWVSPPALAPPFESVGQVVGSGRHCIGNIVADSRQPAWGYYGRFKVQASLERMGRLMEDRGGSGPPKLSLTGLNAKAKAATVRILTDNPDPLLRNKGSCTCCVPYNRIYVGATYDEISKARVSMNRESPVDVRVRSGSAARFYAGLSCARAARP